MSKQYAISTNLPIQWNKLCLIGNRWHCNFGDELIVIGLIKLLQINRSFSTLYIAWWQRDFLQKFHSSFFNQHQLFHFRYLQEIPHGIRSLLQFIIKTPYHIIDYLRCDTFILGWWELFTEETPGSYLYRRRSLFPIRVRLLFGFRTSLYIMWWVQLPSRWYNTWIVKMIINKSAWSFLRDQESVDIVRSLRKKDDTIDADTTIDSWFIDTSYFAYGEQSSHSATLIASRHIDTSPPHIIINSNPLSPSWSASLVEIIQSHLERWYSIYFLPAFFTPNPSQDDMVCYHQLHKQFPSLLILDWRDRESFIPIFLSAYHIYCSRLHIFLIASFFSLPVTPYPYQKKIVKNTEILKMTWILK